MSDLRQAAQQALDALEAGDWYIGQLELIVYSADDDGVHENRAKVQTAIQTLKASLAQQGEPSDLVKRLRETASKGVSVWGDLQMEAAKEIEILTAERELYASAMDRMKTALAQQTLDERKARAIAADIFDAANVISTPHGVIAFVQAADARAIKAAHGIGESKHQIQETWK